MNDAEEQLRRLKPRGAPADLRLRVLAGVSGELQLQRVRRNDWRLLLIALPTVAAALVFAAWSRRDGSERIARVLGPRPVPSTVTEIVQAVEPALDSERARQLTRRLMSTTNRRSAGKFDMRRYHQLLDAINFHGRES